MRDQAVQRALQLADVGGDLVRQELQHLGRHRHPAACGLGLQDREAQLVGRGVQVGHHAAAQPGAQPVLDVRAGPRATCRRTPRSACPARPAQLKVWKNSSCVLSLPIRNCRSSTISTSTLRSVSLNSMVFWLRMRGDEAVHELLGGHVGDRIGSRSSRSRELPGDRVHQVGLAQADAAVEEQRIEPRARRAARRPGGRRRRRIRSACRPRSCSKVKRGVERGGDVACVPRLFGRFGLGHRGRLDAGETSRPSRRGCRPGGRRNSLPAKARSADRSSGCGT